jgi:hypothetical protein
MGLADHVIPGDVAFGGRYGKRAGEGQEVRSPCKDRAVAFDAENDFISLMDTERIAYTFGDSHLALGRDSGSGIHRDLLTDKMK